MTGKIVFAAPSRPLVMQQIEACHNIVGIPQVKQVLQGELASGKLNEFLCYTSSVGEGYSIW
ncbi:DEAD-box ATP-dependent RNA helicase FANCM [Vitis vinifera]|uniref:DEAD-box ATP-dependent RNA helicase FANCM n=1 Tax=Vitis vinifera TaxID=29760 RepID=A0A438JW97_VITVI|nr:DEAD-box ATP-dependent RNA helicase FANCM [Vitis vinifera]